MVDDGRDPWYGVQSTGYVLLSVGIYEADVKTVQSR